MRILLPLVKKSIFIRYTTSQTKTLTSNLKEREHNKMQYVMFYCRKKWSIKFLKINCTRSHFVEYISFCLDFTGLINGFARKTGRLTASLIRTGNFRLPLTGAKPRMNKRGKNKINKNLLFYHQTLSFPFLLFHSPLLLIFLKLKLVF